MPVLTEETNTPNIESLPEDETARKAEVVRYLSIGLLVAISFGWISAIIAFQITGTQLANSGDILLTINLGIGGAFIISLITYCLYKLGKITAAGYFLVGSMLLHVSVITALSGDITSSVAIYYLFPILVAPMVINIKAGFFTAGLATVFYLIIFGFDRGGFLPSPLVTSPEATISLAQILGMRMALFYIATFLSWFAVSRLNRALQNNRRYSSELQTANERLQTGEEELRAVNEGLEERVKERTRELTEKTLEVEKANQQKSEVLANTSHELRTPLNIIMGFSELLIDEVPGKINEEQKQCLNDVCTSSQHLLNLINGLLDLSKVESGNIELKSSIVDLARVISSLTRKVIPILKPRNQILDTEIQDGLPLVYTDENKISQVLLNLLDNASKFTPDGRNLKLKAGVKDGWCTVSVIDSGIGINKEDQIKIFEPFSRLENPFTRERIGTGLGLTLVKQTIERYGGQIWIESEPGKGSNFTFTLPLAADNILNAEKASRR